MKLLMITRKVDRNDSLAGFTYRWVRCFAESVEELHVICLEQGDSAGLPQNCHIYSLGKEKGKNRVREFIRFQQYARKLIPKVDGVFSHQNPEYGILIAPWTKLYRKDLIAWYTHAAVTWKLRLLTLLANRLVTASAESFRLATPKLTVLSHGIETDLFVPEKKTRTDVREILTVSRISRSKNIHLMIELFERLSREISGTVQLKIIGSPVRSEDSEYLAEIKKVVHEKKLDANVSFAGAVPYQELPKEYPQADLFLNFSDTGSLDKAVLEAMSCGIPVLTTNEAFRSIFETLDPRCFASKDLDVLTKKAVSILNSDTQDLAARERQFVAENHSLKKLIGHILALYA